MVTVRFPNGQAIQYNDGAYINRLSGYTDIYTKKDGQFLAQVPNTCIIEYVHPCRVYNPIANVPNEELEALKKEIQSMKRKLYRMK